MKKLLVILLLFFPVHGAWAETFYLKCTEKTSSKDKTTLGFKFDTSKKTVINEVGNTINIEVNDTVIIWYPVLELTLVEATKEIREFVGIESGDLIKIIKNTLNRHSGLMITELYITSVKNYEENQSMGPKAFTDTLKEIYVLKSQCEKSSIKKKF